VPAKLLVCSALAGGALAAAAPALACSTTGYRYAGLATPSSGYGIAATITPLPASTVSSGHIGAWVGVVERNAGAAWLQVGVSRFPDGSGYELFYELRLPGAAAVYHQVAAGWPAGKAARVAVLELGGRPDYWRVWVNGAPASPPVRLLSSARLAPIATAESFDTNAGAGCNGLRYRFERVAVAQAPGGRWQPLAGGVSYVAALNG
jgi:hypothetical protein